VSSRKHHKRRAASEHYAMLPDEMLTSDACLTLPNSTFRIMVAFAAQYRGNNGGDLAMTAAIGKRYGINSKRQLIDGLAILQERGLIQKTRQGGKRPLGPCLYALTWQRIDACNGKLDIGPTAAASNAWANWVSAPPGDQTKTKRQHHRGTRSAPQGDQSAPVSVPPWDQSEPINGTTGGAPSRVWWEGTDLSSGPSNGNGSATPRRYLSAVK
jgi:hypothetical protein